MDKLEGKAKPGGHPEAPTGFAAEVREIDREIAELEAEIAAAETRMSPAELAAWRREQAAWEAAWETRMGGCSLDERIADLDREIAALEAEEGGRVVADGRMHRGQA